MSPRLARLNVRVAATPALVRSAVAKAERRGRTLARLAGLLALCGAVRPALGQPARAPNIIVILADDLGYSDVGCFGGEIETPAFARAAARSLIVLVPCGRRTRRPLSLYSNTSCLPIAV